MGEADASDLRRSDVRVGDLCLVDEYAWLYTPHPTLRDCELAEEMTTPSLGIVLEVSKLSSEWEPMCRMLLADGRLGWVGKTHLV